MIAEQSLKPQTDGLSEAREVKESPISPVDPDSKDTASFVVFRLDGERFAFPLDEVVLALRMVALTLAPDAPPWAIGVMDLHGRVIPVMDLRKRLGHPAKEPHRDDRLLVMSFAERMFALVADEVTEVLELPGSEVKIPPDLLSNSGYPMGVVAREDGLIFILDSTSLFPTEGLDASCSAGP
jgi:purine-binding chemotaxis protein CheW